MIGLVFNNKINGKFQSDCNLLKGGISIPQGADMDSDTYKVPGNYYCSNNSIAESLINSPVYNAFILKVDYSNGHIYPRQTFCNYTNDIITSRTWDPYANKWGKFHQIALKSDLSDVLKPAGTANLNANNVKNLGIYDVLQSNNTENYPTDDGNGILLVFAYNPNRIAQMFIYFDGTMWTRMYWHGTWRSWLASNNA